MLEQGRFVVGDAVWQKVAPLLPGKASDPGATVRDNRLFLEAVLWRVRTGAPWRDLPGDFGRWNSVLIYSVHARIRKSLGEMTRKLSDTASQ